MVSKRARGGAGYGLLLLAVVFAVQAACSGSRRPAKAEPATQPAATQPSSERILVRIGDKAVVTQAEVEALVRNQQPARRRAAAYDALGKLATNKLFQLYLEDHPGFVTEADVQKEIDADMKKMRMKSQEDWKKSLAESNISWESYLDLARIRSGRSKFAIEGSAMAKDEALLRKTFDEHPDHFDGSTVKIRQILFAVPLTATPDQKKQRLEEITKLREELLSGKKTWEEAVKLSNDNTRNKGGLVGSVPRYMRLSEPFIREAWKLQPGQTSEIVESPMGYHIVQVLQRSPGYRDFNAPHTQFELRAVIEIQPVQKAMEEAGQKYPTVGVNPIDMNAIMALPAPPTQPARTPATRPTRSATRPTTRPGMRPATRPSTRRPPIGRPTTRPATRPLAVGVPATRPVRPAVPPLPLPAAATMPAAQPLPGR